MQNVNTGHATRARGKGGKRKAPAPAPVETTECAAVPGALALAGGDRARVVVIDQRTAMTRNAPGLAGPPWPPRRAWQR